MIEGELYYYQSMFRIFGNYFMKRAVWQFNFELHHVEFCKVPLPPPS
jgi:hypothetical protein